MQESTNTWYANWFDTPYYHILYKDRDHAEAQLFLDNITHYLNLPENAQVLDLACGRGRHSIYLNKLGYNVLGTDYPHKVLLTPQLLKTNLSILR